jgi:aryl-alcohol dehydrogenase-like predicted oxidoreductase
MPETGVLIGNLRVSPVCLGGNRFGTGLDESHSFRLLDAFAECGGNFVDTARIYSDWVEGAPRGASEAVLGKWLRTRRPKGFVVATKGGHPALDAPSNGRLNPDHLRSDIDASREALGIDCLPLFYLHRDDEAVPVPEIVEILEGFRVEGAIGNYAASNWRTGRLEAALQHARRCGAGGFVANQPEWSVIRRNPGTRSADLVAADAAMISFHRITGLPMVPYSSQAQGYVDKVLTDKLDATTAQNYDSPENRALAYDLAEEAKRANLLPIQVLLRRLVTVGFPLVPIIGCRTPEQVRISFSAIGRE